jgi:hypothetical protein
MVFVYRLPLRILPGELVPPVHLRQDRTRSLDPRQSLRHRRRHPGQERGSEKKSPSLLVQPPEDLAPEIVDDLRGHLPNHRPGLCPFPVRPLEKHEPGRPAVGPLEKVPHQSHGRPCLPLQFHDSRSLLEGQAEFLPSERLHEPAGPVARESGVGVAAADEDRADTRRQAGDPLPERLEERRVLPHAMAVVQHQEGGNRKQRGEVLEIPPREYREAGHAFRGQQRKALPLPRRGLHGGQPQVVEEGGEVRVSLVDLVPEARETPGFDVAADQGGLPASGRPRDPEHRRLAGPVQETVQPLPREIAGRSGAGDLRDWGRRCHCIPRGGGSDARRVTSRYRVRDS